MHGWQECKTCKGTGFKRIPRGIATCHDEPDEPYAVFDRQVLTKSEADKMVGG